MHQLSEDELEAFISSGNGLYLAAFGVTAGAFISLVITIKTIAIADPLTHATFFSMAWVTGSFCIFSGVRVWMDHRSLNEKLKKYREASKRMNIGSPNGTVLNGSEGEEE